MAQKSKSPASTKKAAKPVDNSKKADKVEVVRLSENVVESFVMVKAKHSLPIYGERLMLCLVQLAQRYRYGETYEGTDMMLYPDPYSSSMVVEIDLHKLTFEEKGDNYTNARDAVKSLMQIKHEHEVPKYVNGAPVVDKRGNLVYQYEAHQLLNDVYVNDRPNYIRVDVNRHTWEALMDFGRGYRRYDMNVARKCKHSRTLKMYKMVSGQNNPMRYSVEWFRSWFLGEENEAKYKQTRDLVKELVKIAEELGKFSPFSFDVDTEMCPTAPINVGRRGHPAISHIIITPKHLPQFEAEDSSYALNLRQDLLVVFGPEIYRYLTENYEFTRAEIERNYSLFVLCKKVFGQGDDGGKPDFVQFLKYVSPLSDRVTNKKGYLVNALRKHLEEEYGITFEGSKVYRDQKAEPVQGELFVEEETNDTDEKAKPKPKAKNKTSSRPVIDRLRVPSVKDYDNGGMREI